MGTTAVAQRVGRGGAASTQKSDVWRTKSEGVCIFEVSGR
jgi:hypothetical protein